MAQIAYMFRACRLGNLATFLTSTNSNANNLLTFFCDSVCVGYWKCASFDAHPWGGLRHTTAPWWVVSPRRGLGVAGWRGLAPDIPFSRGFRLLTFPAQKARGLRYVRASPAARSWLIVGQILASVCPKRGRHFRRAPDGRNVIRGTRHVEFSKGWTEGQRGGHR